MAIVIKSMALGFPKPFPEAEPKKLATEDPGLPFQQRHRLHRAEE